MVLLTVLMVAALLSVTATTVAYHSTQSLQRSQTVQIRLQAEMAAVAGLKDALSRLRAVCSVVFPRARNPPSLTGRSTSRFWLAEEPSPSPVR